jgi:hypothetical protein
VTSDLIQTLGVAWARCRSIWRDSKAPEFEQLYVRTFEASIRQVESHAASFEESFATVRIALLEMGFQDPNRVEAELERRQQEAQEEWSATAGDNRRSFGLQFGVFGHQQFEKRLIAEQTLKGRELGTDYDVERSVKHPDGRQVRFDFVDLKSHQIVDYKTARPGESEADVQARHQEQRQRHIEAYAHAYGVVPKYDYVTYPSTTGLFDDAESPDDPAALDIKDSHNGSDNDQSAGDVRADDVPESDERTGDTANPEMSTSGIGSEDDQPVEDVDAGAVSDSDTDADSNGGV